MYCSMSENIWFFSFVFFHIRHNSVFISVQWQWYHVMKNFFRVRVSALKNIYTLHYDMFAFISVKGRLLTFLYCVWVVLKRLWSVSMNNSSVTSIWLFSYDRYCRKIKADCSRIRFYSALCKTCRTAVAPPVSVPSSQIRRLHSSVSWNNRAVERSS